LPSLLAASTAAVLEVQRQAILTHQTESTKPLHRVAQNRTTPTKFQHSQHCKSCNIRLHPVTEAASNCDHSFIYACANEWQCRTTAPQLEAAEQKMTSLPSEKAPGCNKLTHAILLATATEWLDCFLNKLLIRLNV
jgi:hypothetical protein